MTAVETDVVVWFVAAPVSFVVATCERLFSGDAKLVEQDGMGFVLYDRERS